MQKLQDAVSEWTNKIKDSIEIEEKKARDRVHDSSSGETEFWTTRNAKYNMLYQQLNMNQVKIILRILRSKDIESFSLEAFNHQQKEFQKQHAKAKDFVKFLTTLER